MKYKRSVVSPRWSVKALWLFAAFLATSYFLLPTSAFPQEVVITVPIHPAPRYDSTKPMLTLQQGVGATGDLQQWKNTAGVVKLSVDASGSLIGPPASYSSTGSYQPVGVDLTLGSAAGKDHPNTAYLAPIMGNLFGNALTKTGDYLGGLIGVYSITGATGSHYPVGAVLGGIGDGSTGANGAFVAWIDGDSAQTNAGAAFKVRNRNSVPNSGFAWGLDLYDASTDGYPAVSYTVGDIRLHTDARIYSGTGDPNGNLSATDGSIYLRTGTATASTILYVCTGTTTWTAVTVP